MAFNVNRVPQDFREAMKHISAKQADNQNMRASEMAAKAPQAPKSAGDFCGDWNYETSIQHFHLRPSVSADTKSTATSKLKITPPPVFWGTLCP